MSVHLLMFMQLFYIFLLLCSALHLFSFPLIYEPHSLKNQSYEFRLKFQISLSVFFACVVFGLCE